MAQKPPAMIGQLESALTLRKMIRDSALYMLPAIILSVVLLFVGPHWAQILLGVVDILFALMALLAVSVAIRLWSSYGRRHSLALAAYGGYLVGLAALAALLFLG
jgi:hypothetical protein